MYFHLSQMNIAKKNSNFDKYRFRVKVKLKKKITIATLSFVVTLLKCVSPVLPATSAEHRKAITCTPHKIHKQM